MPASNQFNRKTAHFTALATSLVIMVTALVCHIYEKWRWLKVPSMLPKFSDLALVTYAAECARKLPDWSIDSASCHPNGLAYNYPSLWVRILKPLGVTGDSTSSIGVALFVIFGLCAYVLIRYLATDCSPQALALVSLGFLSPPTWLVLERGNADSVIFVLVSVAAIFAAQRSWVHWMALPLAALAINLKVFPAGASVFLARERIRAWVIYVVLIVALGGWTLVGELRQIQVRTLQSHEKSFGVNVLTQHIAVLFGGPIPSRYARLIGMATFLAVAALTILVARRPRFARFRFELGALAGRITESPLGRPVWLAFGGAFVFAFFAGSNWDYRLIFLYPLLVVLASHISAAPKTTYLCILVIGVLFMSYPAWHLQPVGDVAVLVLVMIVSVITYLVVLEELPPTLAQPLRRLVRAVVR